MSLSRLLILLLLVLPASADPRSLIVLFFGDSITAGMGLDPDEAFPALVKTRADSAGIPILVINAGLSGETSSAGLRRVDWLLRRPVDVVVLELGANDGLRGIDLGLTRVNLQGIIDRIRAASPEASILLAGMKVPPNLGKAYAERFEQVFVDLAQSNALPLIPFLLEGVGGVPGLNLADGKHPNADGHRVVAETVWQTLRPVLQAKLVGPAVASPSK